MFDSLSAVPSSSNIQTLQPCNRQLFAGFDDDSQNPSTETLKVFLRIKPLPNCQSNIFELKSNKVLLLKPTSQARNAIKDELNAKFQFTHIFNENSSQKEVFDTCAGDVVKEFLNGRNCLLFTYGTTSSGKTFTVQGTQSKPGLIPRLLNIMFRTVGRNLEENVQYMPVQFDDLVELPTEKLRQLSRQKDEILNSELFEIPLKDVERRSSFIQTQTFKKMQNLLEKDFTDISFDNNESTFSIWVSFAEIYNEAVYDLLQPLKIYEHKRQLKIIQDTNGNSYIKDLTCINVRDPEEAYKILLYGEDNLQVAATKLNQFSSRSHCIFTVIMVAFSKQDDADYYAVSRFSLCDLAGAERQKKTLNAGDRLFESRNINTSLHVLSRCFSILRQIQSKGEKLVVPYRESKLTSLFRNALNGNESIRMIVNVSPHPNLFEETHQILRSTAVASSLKMSEPPRRRRAKIQTQRVSNYLAARHGTISESLNLPSINEQSLLSEIESLKLTIESLKENQKTLGMLSEEEKLQFETEIRSNMVAEFWKILRDKDGKHKISLEEMEKVIQDLEKEKTKLEKVNWELGTELNLKKRKFERDPDCSVILASSETQVERDLKRLQLLHESNLNENRMLKEEISRLKFELSTEKMKVNEKENMLKVILKAESELEIEKVRKKYEDEIKKLTGIIDDLHEEIKVDQENEKVYCEEIEELKVKIAMEPQKLAQFAEDRQKENENKIEELNEIINYLNTEIKSHEENEIAFQKKIKDLERVISMLKQIPTVVVDEVKEDVPEGGLAASLDCMNLNTDLPRRSERLIKKCPFKAPKDVSKYNPQDLEVSPRSTRRLLLAEQDLAKVEGFGSDDDLFDRSELTESPNSQFNREAPTTSTKKKKNLRKKKV